MKTAREWLEQRLGEQGAEVMVEYVEKLERDNEQQRVTIEVNNDDATRVEALLREEIARQRHIISSVRAAMDGPLPIADSVKAGIMRMIDEEDRA
jgi:cell division FtsZ-interacting protein ZapD